MNRELVWEKSRLKRGNMAGSTDGWTAFDVPAEGLDYLLYSKREDDTLKLGDYCCYGVELRVLEEHSMCFQLSFYEKYRETAVTGAEEEPAMRMIFGLLPETEVTVPVAFEILNSQVIFPERTPGRLKMSIFGKPVRLCDVEEIRFQTAPGYENFRFSAGRSFFADQIPEYTLKEETLVDELGQWTKKEWKGKIQGREALNRSLHELYRQAENAGNAFPFPNRNRFGGFTGKTFGKTGWFHVEKENGRYWLADPDGCAFLSAGIDCIRPEEGMRVGPVRVWAGDKIRRACEEEGKDFWYFGIENLKEAFGAEWKTAWMKIVKYDLLKWGVNTIGNWSDREFIRFAGLPYVIPMDICAPNGYPQTAVHIFRDFPDVFAAEYEEKSREYAAALEEFRDDPLMIGYFMRNEPAWAFVYGLNIAEEMLANPVPSESRRVFIERMEQKYATPVAFSAAWGMNVEHFADLETPVYKAASLSQRAEKDLKEFSEEMITRYVEIPAKAAKEVDPNHMNLGMRYAYITDRSLLCGAENFDVFSINSYQLTPLEPIEKVSEWLDKPIMVGEFHQGALDRGLTAHGIRGVKDQEQRGCAYRYYVEQALIHPGFVGAHYFQLNDQSCLGRFDGENYQIGLLDVCMQEYDEMAQAMAACHDGMYEVAIGTKAAFAQIPEDIEPIHY